MIGLLTSEESGPQLNDLAGGVVHAWHGFTYAGSDIGGIANRKGFTIDHDVVSFNLLGVVNGSCQMIGVV